MSNSRKHVISLEAQAVIHIARVCERLPRSQIQFRISRSFRQRNPANLGSEICFWIRLKEYSVFDFSWDDCNTLENLETLVMQNSEGDNKVHHGLYESSDYKRCKACLN